MQCPVCKDVQLTMSNRESIEIGFCPQCRGVWLDRGELDKIIERRQRETAAPPPQAPRSRQATRRHSVATTATAAGIMGRAAARTTGAS